MENSEINSTPVIEDTDLSPNENIETIPAVFIDNLPTNSEIVQDENAKSVPANNNEPKLTHLPLSRIKHIMKLDSDVTIVPLECVFLVTKATELFVQSLAREACTFTQQNDKKTLQKRDIDAAIGQVESLIFLEETL